MTLEQYAHFNDLSPKLRTEIEDKVRSYGKKIRYKFDVAKPNPDPSKYNGAIVYPNMYTLDPIRFTIQDPYEDRAGKSKAKMVCLIDEDSLNDKGVPERFMKIKCAGKDRSILELLPEDSREDFYRAMLLELHPKLSGGQFADKNAFQVVSRIDEQSAATAERTERTARLKALNAAQGMSDKELIDFCDAMQWDSSEDPEILRNQVEDLAENDPVYFNDLVEGKSIEYQALIKQAQNKGLITFDPGEYKWVWTGNQQPIAVLSPVGEANENKKLSDFLQSGGAKAEDVYKKLKALVKGEQKEPVT